jgi:16S rRNA (adenine1518-N6/adenine1519-N6)-dimethyltransferase
MIQKPFSHPSQSKSLSQVFLHEQWPCHKMAEELKAQGVESVIEIGPGNGILTKALAKQGLKVVAIEKDRRFAQKLLTHKSTSSDFEQVEVLTQDFLKFDLEHWVASQTGNVAICGNIPYHISSPIVLKVLAVLNDIRCAMLLVQLEYAQRLVSHPSQKTYGSLSVFTQLRSRSKIEYKVERHCFYPIPKVDSAVISLKSRVIPYPDKILSEVEKITRQVFTQRRKKLSNSLAPFLKSQNPGLLPIDVNRRCDSLSPEEYVSLAETLLASPNPQENKSAETRGQHDSQQAPL